MASTKISIFASLMCADQLRLGEEIKKLEEAGIDGFHMDIMDGMFVPNLTLGFPALRDLRGATSLPLDVHLMIKEPERFVRRFVDGGADIISFHYESTKAIEETLKILDSSNVKKAIAIKPGTEIEEIYPYLSGLDMVLVMSVEPGFAGGKFVPQSPGRIEKLAGLREKDNLKFNIEVDGNINTDTIPALYKAGARIFVGGSTGPFKGGDYSKEILDLRKACK
ncbi:MAG: ribulose-phosphate 3-epimerase [Candidatus Omnitrophica bacterium]|nr:ribulose-phosphate 3-epimerase [Candidatus Omnitrophota bacterium]